jgi:dienelactone hydrolase
MSEIVLFHSALGLRPGVRWFADRLRAAGHTVHTPDLYDGEVFDSLEDGLAKRDALGMDEVIRRGTVAAPRAQFYAGFSLGAAPAQMLAQTRPGASGALLYHSAIPAEYFGGWPEGVALQIHTMEEDELGDVEDARELGGELYLYPGSDHLFLDPDLAEFDEAAAELVIERSLVFIQ